MMEKVVGIVVIVMMVAIGSGCDGEVDVSS